MTVIQFRQIKTSPEAEKAFANYRPTSSDVADILDFRAAEIRAANKERKARIVSLTQTVSF